MIVSIPNDKIFHADAEHSRLRTVVMVALLLFFVFSYLIVQYLFRTFFQESPIVLVCGLALPLALGGGWVFEMLLKRTWHSGRYIKLEADGIRAVNQVSPDVHLRWAANVSQMRWSFKLSGYPRGGRERRMPANHYCLAVQLQQGGQQVVVYAYLPPKKASAILERKHANFVALDPGEVYESSIRSRIYAAPTRPDIPSKVLAGANGRFWLAEKRRWQEGFELEPQDFETFLQLVEENSK